MENYLLWAFISLGVALLLFVLEFFIPSGGALGVGALLAACAGVFCLYKVNHTTGLVAGVVLVITLPVVAAYGLKVLPHTPLWRMLTLKSPKPDDEDDTDGGAPGQPRKPTTNEAMIGANGVALTDLRPVGSCRINGDRVECLAQGGIIRAGEKVKVVAADGMQVKVRAEG